MNKNEFDWLVIGSGFGGSVAALRLAEKGYRVGVIEAGRRFQDEDFAKSSWNIGRFIWAPLLGCRGILRMTPFSDVFIASGAGVGGGSIVYANTLYRASPEYFKNPQWDGLADWEAELAPHYDTAEFMLGVTEVPFESPSDGMLRDIAGHFGTTETFRRTPVGVFFGEPGVTVSDPYFDGAGPDRTGCTRCGACMVGCREGSKNTLVKNYLWFAEEKGAHILPDREVFDIRPAGAADGSDGYTVTTRRPGAWLNPREQEFHAKGIVLGAGALGTNQLLAQCKLEGSLPRLSDRLGELVRTNSESILAVTLPDESVKPWNSVAISASIHTDHNTHIEFVTYGERGDFMSLLFTMLTGKGSRLTRPLMLIGNVLRHPVRFLKTLWPFGWARRTVIFLVMQTLDNAIAFRARRRRFGSGVVLSTEQDPEKPNPTYIDAANRAAAWLAEKTGGTAQSMILEAAANIPTTAHILGGAVIGKDADHGVIDTSHRVFGYKNMLICDGSAVPANPGVNPSLTITAMAERAMAGVVAKDGETEHGAAAPATADSPA
ncbi:MAG: cholesterol oxidase [Chromatiales bacterium]|jgi:cholesterol oxidase|nr:GMC family oxidoreductase [Chromatiales bacterium]MDH4014504.1 GMC family oxidoreductase [Chromatiales bacterium]PLX55422.1 MAG: cholesterol oxidase [Chromatiales bacterium]